MKRNLSIIAALALGLLAQGCILTSGQIRLSFELPKFAVATSSSTITRENIDLNDESEFTDNKEKLKDLSDIAILGKITNGGSSDIRVSVWMTPDTTSHTTALGLNADGTKVKLWGPFQLKKDESRLIDWDESAKLFDKAGKTALLNEAKAGNGRFSIYAVAEEAVYTFSVSNGVLVFVLDAGI